MKKGNRSFLRSQPRSHLRCLVIASLLLGPVASASESKSNYEYPELLVTPRASERLEREAKEESSRRYSRLLALQVPALNTLLGGLLTPTGANSRDSEGSARALGISVGAGWLAVTAALSAFYEPYTATFAEIQSLPARTPREQLFRERLAEESFDRADRLMRKLTWLSAASNLAANTFILSRTQSGEAAWIAAAIGLPLSLTPFLFPNHYSSVNRYHQDYKKRIYSPIAAATVFNEPNSARLAPGVALSLRF